jgi:septal ring factor EnvC (AmiA/AmiB activator)
MHRETLEIRLATEELWVQLAGAAPPAAMTYSLGRIRTKLADHYRLANAELQAQKNELEKIRCQLVEQHQQLVEQKSQFEQWATGRHDEIEQQAARLVAREEHLHSQQAELQDQAHCWQVERLDYQQQICRLQAYPKPHDTPAPA